MWDFFNKVDGYIQPQNWQEPIEPWLNADYFFEQMSDHDDQEILAMLFRGTWYKAELEYHIVLMPHSKLRSQRWG